MASLTSKVALAAFAVVLISALNLGTADPLPNDFLEADDISEKTLSLTSMDAKLSSENDAGILTLHKRAIDEQPIEFTSSRQKRQATSDDKLESLFLRVLQMFLEANQASDEAVASRTLRLSEQINATITRGGAPDEVIEAFSIQADSIRAFVSDNSVLPKDCGRNPKNPKDVLSGYMPWTVHVGSRDGQRLNIGCLGVIISPYHVLTDVPCAANRKWNVVSTDKDYTVANRWIHTTISSVDDLKKGHAMGIIMLEEPMVFSDNFQPACLPGMFDKMDIFGEEDVTLVGLEDSENGVSEFTWNSKATGPLLCYEGIKKYNERAPFQQNELYKILRLNHMCVIRPLKEAALSVAFRQDPSTGRVQVVGVGPFADPEVDVPIAYTQTQPHRFWLELMVKNSIALKA